jgi:hypothetical protein
VLRVELLDEVQVRAINIANGKNLPESPTLMFEFIGKGKQDPRFISSEIFCSYLLLAKSNFKLKEIFIFELTALTFSLKETCCSGKIGPG